VSYGNKPNEIRHPQAALLANEYVCQRIQSLGYTADLNSDPSVSLTIDINEFGSINVYNQLAGYREFPSSRPGAHDHYGFTGASVDNTNHKDGTVSHTDFAEVATDFLVPIKESASGTAQTRALWFNNCFVDSVSGTYQVDGFASESIALSGSSQQWCLNAWAGSRVGYAPVVTGASGHLDGTHRTSDGDYVILTEDGVKLDDQYWGVSGADDLTAEGGYNFKADSRYYYVFVYTGANNTFPSISLDPASPVGGIREGEIEIMMWDNTRYVDPGIGTAASSLRVLRLQSVDYEISFDREDLKQLYTGTYYKGLNNTNITATITANDSDLEMWALTAGKYFDWNQSSSDVTSMSLADFQNMSNLSMRVDIFNTSDYLLHSSTTLLKSITLHDGKVTSVGDSFDVPGRGTQTIDLSFKRAHFTGTGLVGR